MSAPIQRLCLDLDGTLADSLPMLKRVFAEFLASYRIDEPDVNAAFDRVNGPPLHVVVAQLREAYGIGASVDTMLQRYARMIDAAYPDVTPRPDAAALVATAHRQGWEIVVVTSSSRARTHAWLERQRLSGLVSFCVTANDVQHGKPHPEPYQRGAAGASRVIAIDDSPSGVKSAVDAGVEAYAYAPEPGTDRLFASLPEARVITRMTEIIPLMQPIESKAGFKR